MASFLTREPGPLTILESAAQTLLRRWVPKWHEVFFDADSPLLLERVGPAFKPILTGKRRLLSQLRQLAMYSHAVVQPENFMFRPDLRAHADAIFRIFATGTTGQWAFAANDSLTITDDTHDLYTYAFVIFAMSHYGRATGDPRARQHALATAQIIDTQFRMQQGFAETLNGPPAPRRHESHMHLLEACLDAAAAWDVPLFMTLAGELADLFVTTFYHAPSGVLSEYFTHDLTPAPDPACGKIVCEAGHYYEWIWLLKKHAQMIGKPDKYDETCLSLLAWANRHGWDTQFGGIFDELEPDGGIIQDRKRIWPLTEGLKANALLLGIVPDRDATKDMMAAMATLMKNAYIHERGFWTEWLNRDLSPAVDYMPATTPYHVYFGIMEARAALKARGASKSLRARPAHMIYAALRKASALARSVRKKLR